MAGGLVLAASALSRGGSITGCTYDNAIMASLGGSTELEFGADQIFLLKSDRETDNLTFEHAKKPRREIRRYRDDLRRVGSVIQGDGYSGSI